MKQSNLTSPGFFSNLRQLFSFFRETYHEYQKDHPDLLAAGLGYFAIFSLPPVVIITTAIVGHLWAKEGAKDQVLEKLSMMIGSEAADSVQRLLEVATHSGKGRATVLSLVVLYVAASRIFAQLRTALDIIWDIEPAEEGFLRNMARTWLMNFGMVIGIALFMLAFFILDALLSFLHHLLGNLLPILGQFHLLRFANILLPFFLFALLFACAYKFVPDTHVAWRDVWPGAILTSALFAVGKSAIGLYLSYESFSSLYGAASSVIVILVWIYFATQIFFYGAEFTWLYANRFGSRAPRHRFIEKPQSES